MIFKAKNKALLIVFIILLILGVFYAFFVRVRIVRPGEIGIKVDIGNPVSKDVDSDMQIVKGYVFYVPLYSELVVYPTTIQPMKYEQMPVMTNDGIQFFIRPVISYQLDENKAGHFYKSIRKSLSETGQEYLKELVVSSYTLAASEFSADSLSLNEQFFNQKASLYLAEKMDDVGLLLKSTNAYMEIPLFIKDAIETRNKSLQQALTIKNSYTEIDAKRKADSLLNASLTPLAIQKMFIEKWDGKTPINGNELKIKE